MTDDSMDQPGWIEEPAWDEFQWERFLREQERRAERYMDLMEQYRGHPDRDNMVAREMGWDHLIKECSDSDPDCGPCDRKWRCSYFQSFIQGEEPEDPLRDPPGPLDDLLGADSGDDEDPDDGDEASDGEDYDPDAFQNDPLYQDAFSLGIWLHHMAERIPELGTDACAARLIALAHLVSAKIAAAIGDGEFDELGMTIAYLKRALRACSLSLDMIDELARTRLLPEQETQQCRRRIFAVRDGIVSLVGECREEWRHRYGNI